MNSTERPGLIPSQDLEERRQCFVRNGFNKQVTCCGQKVYKIQIFLEIHSSLNGLLSDISNVSNILHYFPREIDLKAKLGIT